MTLRRDSGALVGTGHVALPRVNLLPPEIAEQTHFRRVQGGLGLTVVAAVCVVGALFSAAAGSASDAQTELDAAGVAKAGLQTQVNGFRDVTAVYSRTAAAEQLLVQAMGPEVRYSRLLDALSSSIPPSVWLTSATFVQTDGGAAPAAGAPAAPAATSAVAATTPAAGSAAAPAAVTGGLGTINFAGVAYAHNDVAAWLESVNAQQGLSGAYLQTSTEELIGSRKVVKWTATANLTTQALSGRYSKVAG